MGRGTGDGHGELGFVFLGATGLPRALKKAKIVFGGLEPQKSPKYCGYVGAQRRRYGKIVVVDSSTCMLACRGSCVAVESELRGGEVHVATMTCDG